MKKLIIFLLLMASSEISFAQAEASFRVYSESTVNRFRQKDHPFKLFQCGGRDTERANDNFNNITDRNQLSGEASLVESRGHGAIRPFDFGQMNWNFEFNPNETIKLRFSQKLIKEDFQKSDMLCNTTRSNSSLNSNVTILKGRARLVVPPNVFVLRIKSVQTKSSEAFDQLKLSIDIPNRSKTELDGDFRRIPTGPDKVHYRFVRPGDIVDFFTEFRSEATNDINLEAVFEIGFLGSYKCDLRAFMSEGSKITSTLLKIIGRTPETPEELDNLILKASCLQNPNFSRELLLNSQGPALATLISELGKKVDLPIPRGSEELEKYHRQTLSYLTLDLSLNITKDLAALCGTTKIKSIFKTPNELEVMTRKYHRASLNYVKIKYILERATPEAMNLLLDYFESHAGKGSTYESLKNNESISTLRLYIKDALHDRVANYGNILLMLKQNPNTQTGFNGRKRLLERIDNLYGEARDLQYQVELEVRKVAAAVNERIDLRNIKSRWQNIVAENTAIRRDLEENIKWYELADESPISSRFASDLYKLSTTISEQSILMQASANKDSILKSALFENQKTYAPLINVLQNNQTVELIQKCLRSPND